MGKCALMGLNLERLRCREFTHLRALTIGIEKDMNVSQLVGEQSDTILV